MHGARNFHRNMIDLASNWQVNPSLTGRKIIRLCGRDSKVTRITCDCFSTSKQDRDDNDAVIIAAASNGSQTKCLLGEPSTTTLTNYTLSLEMKVINRD
jgi:hypothetical protein